MTWITNATATEAITDAAILAKYEARQLHGQRTPDTLTDATGRTLSSRLAIGEMSIASFPTRDRPYLSWSFAVLARVGLLGCARKR
jgi:hypothetical protein